MNQISFCDYDMRLELESCGVFEDAEGYTDYEAQDIAQSQQACNLESIRNAWEGVEEISGW